jgi:hypothetical protein
MFTDYLPSIKANKAPINKKSIYHLLHFMHHPDMHTRYSMDQVMGHFALGPRH